MFVCLPLFILLLNDRMAELNKGFVRDHQNETITALEHNKTLKHRGVVLRWCCSVVLNCTRVYFILNISPNVQYFPILICQKWTKYWT